MAWNDGLLEVFTDVRAAQSLSAVTRDNIAIAGVGKTAPGLSLALFCPNPPSQTTSAPRSARSSRNTDR
jgi:hypothetical protein